MSLAVENILGIIDRDGEEELALDLSSFSCGVNDEIQTFLTDKAIEFARKKMSITYLVSDDEEIVTSPDPTFYTGQDGGRRKPPYAFTEQGISYE
jgi:hypothetical protein